MPTRLVRRFASGGAASDELPSKKSQLDLASARVTVAVALIGLAGAWNAGNVGPVASEIASEFDVSLGVVGLLSGTFLLGSLALGLLVAPAIGARIGLTRGLRLGCLLVVAGNLLFAVTPIFAGLVLGRILPGLAFALFNALGAVWAREAGGVRLVGIFGAAIQLGIAIALLVGSGLADAGVDWRVGFVISAVVGAIAFVAVPEQSGSVASGGGGAGFLSLAMRRIRVYRLSLLFMSIYGVPLILGAWLIEYLSDEGDIRKAVAGVAAFLLFGLSAAARVLGARLQEHGLPHKLLGGSLALAAIGMAAVTFDPVVALTFASVVLLALGFGIPYATAITEAEDLYPEAPSEPMALMTLVAMLPPVIATPVVGHALSRGDGALAFGILAAFLVVAMLANLRPTGIPLTAQGGKTSS